MHLYVRESTRSLVGEIEVPSSKYHAHRALILASLAEGTSRVVGLSAARHVQSTIEVLRGLGTEVTADGDGFVVEGGPYSPVRETVSAGSSGTTLYFMLGLSSLADAPVTLTGQKYFQRRPVAPLLEALGALGIESESAGGTPPVTIQPKRPSGGRVRIAGTLSQWISGILLVAPFATGPTVLEIEGAPNELPYIELTVRMMREFGLEVGVSEDWRRFEIEPGQTARPAEITLPPDLASAAFGLAACALHPADVAFPGLTQTRGEKIDHPEAEFIDLVAEMGLPMEIDEVGQVRVRHDGVALRGVEVDCQSMPDMLPVLTTLAQFAEGETRFRNVEHVRLKESDRVVSMLQLNRMGGDVQDRGEELIVGGRPDWLTGSPLSSFNDHRVHMALTVAASRARGESSLTYPHAYRISYPEFLDDMRAIGLDLGVEDDRAAGREPVTVGGGIGRPVIESVAIDQGAELSIVDWVGRWVRERPGQVAIVDVRERRTTTWTWAQLDEEADRVAALLLELGVERDEAVAYQLPNWAEFVIFTLAAAKIGATGCALMPIFREREVSHALKRTGARVLVIADRFRGRDHLAETEAVLAASSRNGASTSVEHVLVVGAAGAPELPADGAVRWHDLHAAATRRQPDAAAIAARKPAPDAPAHVFFTSGTSGEPKGVVHRFDALTRAALMEVEHLGLGRDDRMFIPTPLAHQTGFLYGMWLAFVLGSAQILQDVWEPARGARALREWEGTFVQAATPFLADLLGVIEDGAPVPPALRIFVVTGAAVPRALAARATEVLSAAVCGAWGSTESCLAALAAPGDDPEVVWGTDGRALAGTRIRISDDEGNAVAPGTEGNFEVSSRCLFDRYLDRPDLTEAAFTPDGWYRTGDLATIDADGYLRITGRVKDVINRGGEKVPVAELEQLLHEHPLIQEVAIAAMPDERLGERACAFVVRNGGDGELNLEEVRRYLDERKVARQYWPERVEEVEEMPRTPSGKIQKFVLRERAKGLRAESPSSTEKEQIS